MTTPGCPRPLAALIQNGKQSSSWIDGEPMPAEISTIIDRTAEHHARILEHNTRAWLEQLAASATKIPADIAPADPLKTLAVIVPTVERMRREALTRPDELRMPQATIDKLAADVASWLHPNPTGEPWKPMSLYGVPIIPDDTIEPGRIEARVTLRPGMTADEIRELIAAGYEFPPVNFGPITLDWTGLHHYGPQLDYRIRATSVGYAPAGTLAHDMAEAHDAFADLFTTITEALRIPQLVDRIARALRRGRKTR